MQMSDYISISAITLTIMAVIWFNVNLDYFEKTFKNHYKIIKQQQVQIDELQKQVNKLDSCEIYIHYHYHY